MQPTARLSSTCAPAARATTFQIQIQHCDKSQFQFARHSITADRSKERSSVFDQLHFVENGRPRVFRSWLVPGEKSLPRGQVDWAPVHNSVLASGGGLSVHLFLYFYLNNCKCDRAQVCKPRPTTSTSVGRKPIRLPNDLSADF